MNLERRIKSNTEGDCTISQIFLLKANKYKTMIFIFLLIITCGLFLIIY